MTVRELIHQLLKMPQHALVIVDASGVKELTPDTLEHQSTDKGTYVLMPLTVLPSIEENNGGENPFDDSVAVS